MKRLETIMKRPYNQSIGNLRPQARERLNILQVSTTDRGGGAGKWHGTYFEPTAVLAITHGLPCGLKKPMTLRLFPCLSIVHTKRLGTVSGFPCGEGDKILLWQIGSNGLPSLLGS